MGGRPSPAPQQRPWMGTGPLVANAGAPGPLPTQLSLAGGASTCPAVREWFVYAGNPLRHPDLVRPLPMNVPGTDSLCSWRVTAGAGAALVHLHGQPRAQGSHPVSPQDGGLGAWGAPAARSAPRDSREARRAAGQHRRRAPAGERRHREAALARRVSVLAEGGVSEHIEGTPLQRAPEYLKRVCEIQKRNKKLHFSCSHNFVAVGFPQQRLQPPGPQPPGPQPPRRAERLCGHRLTPTGSACAAQPGGGKPLEEFSVRRVRAAS